MGKINILDCTLRDGGYINSFQFGNTIIRNIIGGLSRAGIDIIECGFLKAGAVDKNKSVFGSMEQLAEAIGEKNPSSMYVAMIQLGAIQLEMLEDYTDRYADGIRLTFHEHEIDAAFATAEKLMKKGYRVFIQPVGTATYGDETLLSLIQRVNELKPFAFYIVDTLGTMYKKDLLRLFYLVDHNLNEKIALGFHSHNNLQMSFANAQELSEIRCNRNIIIDASVMGMGRGAGNLNTELLAQYLNINHGGMYSGLEILDIVDKYIRPLKAQYKWGYNVAYYLAANKNCHPNYASYLLNMQTLTAKDIEAILNSIEEDKRKLYDEKLVKDAYFTYMNHQIDDTAALIQIKEKIGRKEVVILGSGSSMAEYREDNTDKFVISINFVPEDKKVDMLFVSNLKRFEHLNDMKLRVENTVLTSNIMEDGRKDSMIVNYYSYLNDDEYIRDNAGLMCMNMLMKLGVSCVRLAGFDGYSLDVKENYYRESLYLDLDFERMVRMNRSMAMYFKKNKEKLLVTFATPSVYAQ